MPTNTTELQPLDRGVINTFLLANPGFDLKNANLLNQKAVQALDWEGVEKETLLPQLKALQRLTRLTNEQLTAEQWPEHMAAEALYHQGLHSALHIASMPVHKFVAQHQNAFVPDDAQSAEVQARQVHQRALASKSQTVLTHTAIAQHKSPHYQGTRFDNHSAATDTKFGGLPNYQDLFGDLDFCTYPDCRSIFSPAAYFVDLMRLQDNYVSGGNVPLQTRRPDLWERELSCDKTNTEIPSCRSLMRCCSMHVTVRLTKFCLLSTILILSTCPFTCH